MQVAIGVAVLVEKDDCYLLIKRRKSPGRDTWATPGGRLEFKETFEECAMREALEETGLTLSNLKYRGVTNDLHEESDKHGVTIWMTADHSGEISNNSPEEVAEICWVPKNLLPPRLFLPFQQLMAGEAYE